MRRADTLRPMLAYERLRHHAYTAMRALQRARPRARRDWVSGPPDFVGVAAQKSGTTWWYSLIEAHPGVTARRTPKELNYFNRPMRTMPPYERYFARPVGSLCGEWSPPYSTDEGWMAELRESAPDARILIALRDPVERYVAGLTMAVRQRGTDPRVAAVDAEERSRYGALLDRTLALYPRERILVQQYESMVTDTLPELHRTYEFLGLSAFDPSAAELASPGRKRNVARVPKIDLSPERRAELGGLFAPEVRRVLELVPDLRLDRWPNFTHLGA
jgi:hypothetical protein